jgi:hypothetical protein
MQILDAGRHGRAWRFFPEVRMLADESVQLRSPGNGTPVNMGRERVECIEVDGATGERLAFPC